MFGPNVKSDERGIYYHHREDNFHVLLKALETSFREHFGLSDYDFLFLTGSGTMANETVIFSFRYEFNFLFDDAEFGMRLRKMSMAHGRGLRGKLSSPFTAYPLYETSISRFNLHKNAADELEFLDMVSAFPYYMPPKDTAIWTTVSSKQLGAYPVISIIGIHKDLDIGEYFLYNDHSCLNLLGHYIFRANNETQTTPSIPLYYDLLKTLCKFNRSAFVKKIDNRRRKILHILGVDNIMGCGPVITLKEDVSPNLKALAKQFNLYKGGIGYQIFLWSGTDEEYETFYRALRRIK